jgi:hypothetical protein
LPEEISASIQPATGTTPFTGIIHIHSLVTAPPGLYTYQISASSENVNHSLSLHINVTTNLNVTIHTDKNHYLKGQTIHLFGNATTTEGYRLDDSDVMIWIATGKRDISLTTHLRNNSFDYYYPISYGDNEGQWTIQTRVVDNNTFVGIQTTNLTVSLPPGILRYTIDFFSPPNNAIYRRGDSFSISVYVSENSIGVQNTTTQCTLPSMETIPLLEYSPGNYKQNYTIPWNAPLGEMFFTIDSIKNTSGILKAGGSALSIIVEPAPLQLTVVKPTSLQVSTPSTIPFEVEVRYPDSTMMTNGDVFLVTPRGNISLQDENNGIYTVTISVTDQDVGSQVIEIHARDSFGNAGTMKKIVVVLPVSQSSVFVSFIPLFAACACCIIGVVCTRRFYKGHHLRSIQEEMKATQRLKEETGKKYFVEGSISKEIYEALMYEHVERYSQLQKEERKMLNK